MYWAAVVENKISIECATHVNVSPLFGYDKLKGQFSKQPLLQKKTRSVVGEHCTLLKSQKQSSVTYARSERPKIICRETFHHEHDFFM